MVAVADTSTNLRISAVRVFSSKYKSKEIRNSDYEMRIFSKILQRFGPFISNSSLDLRPEEHGQSILNLAIETCSETLSELCVSDFGYLELNHSFPNVKTLSIHTLFKSQVENAVKRRQGKKNELLVELLIYDYYHSSD